VGAARAAEEVGVAEVLVLQQREQLALVETQLDRLEPGVQQRAGVVGAEVGADRAAARVGLGHEALDHGEDRRGVAGLLAAAAPQRADCQRHRGVRPLRGAALLAARGRLAGADVSEVLVPGVRARRLGERAPDVDSRVVVRAADAGAAVRLDVDRGGRVELTRARAVAGLPDAEQLRQAAAVARGQGRLDRVERVRQRAGDLVLVQVLGDLLDVVGVRLQPVVVVGGDAVAEDVHRLWLALEPRRELLGDEDVRAVGDLQHARDGVVIGDGHEVHPAALGQLVDLIRRRRALGQSERALDPELRELRGGRVAVQVHPARGANVHLTRADSPAKHAFL
jgi:hypothetical protein